MNIKARPYFKLLFYFALLLATFQLKAQEGEPKKWSLDKCIQYARENNIQVQQSEINQKIAARNKARKNKDYKAADEIRNELLDKGVLIEDKDDKTLWKFK